MECEREEGKECTYDQCEFLEECFEITHLKIISDGKTLRGFDYLKFYDKYGAECSLQASSLATEAAIWLGIEDANPQIMAKDYPQAGKSVGWVPYPIPDNVLLSTRMHLTQTQVRELLPYLQRFAETGECREEDGATQTDITEG